MVQQSDTAHHLTDLLYLVRKVAWITDDHLGTSHLTFGLDTDRLTTLVDHLFDGSVQHVGATVECRQTSKGLRQLTQTVLRIDVRRATVACQRVHVQLDLLHRVHGGLLQVVVITMKSQRMTNKVHSRRTKTVLFEYSRHCHCVQIKATMSLGVLLFVALHKLEKALATTLLHHTEQRARERLSIGGRDLMDLTTLVHVASVNLLKFKVLGNIRLDEHIDEFTTGHDELGHQVDAPVTTRAIHTLVHFTGLLLLLEELLQSQRGTLTAIVRVAVHVQNLLLAH
mmetsp:Transcript_12966/g.33095  ORF Transcript_12966/g.33095 Transcript_12966/m.33095 type:complete len:283 (-) Transcript_12966:264-1112(-)